MDGSSECGTGIEDPFADASRCPREVQKELAVRNNCGLADFLLLLFVLFLFESIFCLKRKRARLVRLL